MKYGGSGGSQYGGSGAGGIAAGDTLPTGLSIPSPTITGTVTAAQVTGIEIVVAKWGVPVILASSGTMGNNGAVSGMTALPATYSSGAWLYLPANAIQAGSAAGFWWFKASSTTAGTVYNSTFDGASVPGVGTDTAFVSTGPGAFTGVAAGTITAVTVSIPAGGMGPNGHVLVSAPWSHNTAAGNKTFFLKHGATTISSTVASTTQTQGVTADIWNMGAANAQQARSSVLFASSTTTAATYGGAVDTTAAVSLVLQMEKATATNHMMIESGVVKLVYGS